MTRSPDTMEIRIAMAHSLLDPSVFDRVLTALRDPIVPPLRYGRVQPLRHPLSHDGHAVASEFDKDRHLLVGAQAKRFHGSLLRHVEGLNWLQFSVAASLWRAEWVDWLLRLTADTPVLFASICSAAENEAKHATRRALPGAGSARGWIGATYRDFYRFLPGIYWITLLGSEAASGLDLDAARACPAVEITELVQGQVMLRFSSDPFAETDLPGRLIAEQRVATALGDTYFFDRDRTGRKLSQVPAISAVLAPLHR